MEFDFKKQVCIDCYNEEEKKLLERDLETAAKVQNNLLPNELPVLDGYQISVFSESAGIVGGDYFDFFCGIDSNQGFVIGDGLTQADLMGFIKEFYSRLGIHKIRFKPTYNPYTEPSIEAHYYDEHKKKWYALINSGIFRPESLYPYGIKKSIIAWGMGASRVASLLNNKNNLRELVGPTVDFDWIATHKTPQPDLEGGEQ